MSSAIEVQGAVGESAAMQEVWRLVHRVARTRATLLIRGETGTGKQVVARMVHGMGPTADGPFVTVDCTNIPANLMESELFGHERGAFTDAKTRKIGLMEAANGGSVFLDEIGLMPLELQAKMLHVLETQRFRHVGGTEEFQVAVRFLAATNENLEDAVQEGRFREDLYYRLNVVPIDLPPLRDRGSDILLIADRVLEEYATMHGVPARGFSDNAASLLEAYQWPGNVRELRNVVERAVLMADKEMIEAEDLSINRRASGADGVAELTSDPDGRIKIEFPPQGLPLEDVEKEIIIAALEHTRNNVTRAAELLHISRDTLRYRIGKYQLRSS